MKEVIYLLSFFSQIFGIMINIIILSVDKPKAGATNQKKAWSRDLSTPSSPIKSVILTSHKFKY
jgi:hypothetical protein